MKSGRSLRASELLGVATNSPGSRAACCQLSLSPCTGGSHEWVGDCELRHPVPLQPSQGGQSCWFLGPVT